MVEDWVIISIIPGIWAKFNIMTKMHVEKIMIRYQIKTCATEITFILWFFYGQLFLKITLLKCHWTWKGHVKSNTEFLKNKQLKTMKALTWDITNPFKTDLNIIK